MNVVVLGARGHTGAMLVPALEARGAKVTAHGRDVPVTDRDAVRAALKDADAVANLAGPFLRNGTLVVEEAIRRGIPYADTTGEQGYMRLVQERYHKAALDAGSPLVQAFAYEYALSDLAATAHFPEGGDALHVLYRARGARGSAGTKKSVLWMMGAPMFSYENGKLVREIAVKHTRRFTTPEGPRQGGTFAGGEAVHVPQHLAFRTVRSYIPQRRPAMARAVALAARGALHGPILRAAERAVDRRHKPPQNARADSEIVLERDGPTGRVVIRVGDPYRATAEVLAEGLVTMKGAGWLAPGQAVAATMVLAALARRLPSLSLSVVESSK